MTIALAQSYTEHLKLIVSAEDRGANLRDFVDPWWCFERQGPFVRQRRDGAWTAVTMNKPCPRANRQRLLSTDWVSSAARDIIESGSQEKCLIVDHAIPLRVVRESLFKLCPDDMTAFLKSFIKRATITRSEDEILRANGLNSCMPEGVDPTLQPFARYDYSNIEGEPAQTIDPVAGGMPSERNIQSFAGHKLHLFQSNDPRFEALNE